MPRVRRVVPGLLMALALHAHAGDPPAIEPAAVQALEQMGSYLRSLALRKDVHLGETKQGIIVGDILPYAQQ